MTRQLAVLLCVAALALGCETSDDHVPSNGPPPISGGTLEVVDDGRYAIASDPDRASVHVVDLESGQERHRILLEENDEPGRVAQDADGRVHVVLRRAGQVATLDHLAGTVTERRDVCRAPRGIAVDGADLLVACAGGELVRLGAAGGPVRDVVKLEPDLRDVVVLDDGRALVSRFRSAEVLVVQDGVAVRTISMPEIGAASFSGARTAVPTVAWRMRPAPGGAILLHQHSVSSQLGTLGMPALGAQYYGGACDTGVIRSSVSRVWVGASEGTDRVQSLALQETSLGVDVAYDEPSGSIYVAAAAEPGTQGPGAFSILPGRSGVRRVDDGLLADVPTCVQPEDPFDQAAAAIGVAITPDGRPVGQYRDPATLRIGRGATMAMSGGRVDDLGHALFHEEAGTGATCAGCHPEGADDGHVWLFDIGMRRTQSLTGGILDTAPFHWTGDVDGSTQVMSDTFVMRMGGAMPREDEIRAFERWVDALPATPAPVVDEGAAARGERLFATSGCADCHSGERRTNNAIMNVGTGIMANVPALYEMVYRAPYFHDGRAATLEEAVSMHGDTEGLTEAQRADIATFLRSL